MSVKLRWDKQNIFAKASRLFKSLGQIAGDSFLKQDLARFTRDMVYKRTKSGKGVSSDTKPFRTVNHTRLQPLSKNYKRYRRTGIVEFTASNGRVAKINVGRPALGEYGSPNKSNLTMSGQMLSSMTFDVRRYGFIVYIPGTSRRGSSVTNSQIAKWVSKQGRPFMNLTAGESRIVKSRMRKYIQKELRKRLR